MASHKSSSTYQITALFFLVLFCFYSNSVSSFEYQVGGKNRWMVPPKNDTRMFNDWASKNRFTVGDSWEDFKRNGLSSIVTVGVRDIQGLGFPEEFNGKADSVFLDLPQPWLAIPSVAKILKLDGVLCSFSPCIEQVQKSCESLRTSFTDIRTFEILLRLYEIKEGKMGSLEPDENGSFRSFPGERKKCTSESDSGREISNSPSIMVRPSPEAKGQTGYFTFARLQCIF